MIPLGHNCSRTIRRRLHSQTSFLSNAACDRKFLIQFVPPNIISEYFSLTLLAINLYKDKSHDIFQPLGAATSSLFDHLLNYVQYIPCQWRRICSAPYYYLQMKNGIKLTIALLLLSSSFCNGQLKWGLGLEGYKNILQQVSQENRTGFGHSGPHTRKDFFGLTPAFFIKKNCQNISK